MSEKYDEWQTGASIPPSVHGPVTLPFTHELPGGAVYYTNKIEHVREYVKAAEAGLRLVNAVDRMIEEREKATAWTLLELARALEAARPVLSNLPKLANLET